MADLERPAAPNRVADRIRDTIEFVGLARLVGSAASVVLVAAGCWWLVHSPAPPIERSLPQAGISSTTTTLASDASTVTPRARDDVASGSIVVQAAGAVARPGVYELPAGSRLHELITAAGGALADADPNALALASVLADGQREYVPLIGEIPPAAAVGAGGGGTAAPSGPIDLNRASADELDALPGVGPATAQAIVAHREANGPFSSVEGLLDVRGIGPAKFESLRDLVTV